MNYFELLDLEQKYDLDLQLLQKQYLSKQATHHPDKYKDAKSRVKQLDISMQLNTAYNTLKDDYLRAEYLLKILGQKFDDESLKGVLSFEELEDIVKFNEELEETEQLPELLKLKNIKTSERLEMIDKLQEYFKEKNLAKALEITVRLKYLTNLVRNINLKIKNADSRHQ